MMTDFEVAIINATKDIVDTDKVKYCFFHFSQKIFLRIQAEGLQLNAKFEGEEEEE